MNLCGPSDLKGKDVIIIDDMISSGTSLIDSARKIKENFAVCSSSYADNNDVMQCKTMADEDKEISQVGISKVVEARIEEILKLAKNEIKNLTKREIRYIIITGGLSELAGFSYFNCSWWYD